MSISRNNTRSDYRGRLVEMALRGQRGDRIACFPLVDLVFAAAFDGQSMAAVQLDPALHARALDRCLRELPIDGVYVNICFSRSQAAGAAVRDGQYTLKLEDCLEIRFAENDVAAIARTEITSLHDCRIQTAELFHPGMLETFQAMDPELKRNTAVCAGLTGAFCQLGFLYGLQNLMTAMIDRPAEVRRALDRRQEIALRQARELAAAGARFVWIGEGMASGSLISPAMYREFVLPYEQELTREIRRQGGLSLLHVCGNITPMLAEIAECGADGADIDAPADWPAVVRVLGPKICLKGNINPILFLPENVERLASACETTLGEATGLPNFILSTGCLVPRDSCRKAFETMARACQTALPAVSCLLK
jgi:uroporphyrinogen-III decarboxylase